jgi:hypothetical protein
MVTFSPHLRHNSPRLNGLAIRSNEYLRSKGFLLITAPIRCYDFLCYLDETSLTLPAAPALTLAFSIACSLFPLIPQLLSFVFNTLQPLFPKTPGWGVPRISFQLPTAHYPPLTTRSPLSTFRVNTCKSASKQSTLTTFRMNTYAKKGEGGTAIPVPPTHSSLPTTHLLSLRTTHCPLPTTHLSSNRFQARSKIPVACSSKSTK